MKPLIQLKNIHKSYPLDGFDLEILKGINLEIAAGEFVAIMGPSGSGKSTLMNILGCLDTPTSGEYILDGENIEHLSGDQLAEIRNRKIGFVFQAYNLVPVLNVYENIVLPIQLDGGVVDTDFVEQIIDILGLSEKINSLPNQLSGGQQQRVAIARALATKPSIILADEPTGGVQLVV